MEFSFRYELANAKKAAMGEIYNLAKENLKPGNKIINFASGHPATDIFQDKFIKKYLNLALEEGEKDILQYGPHIGYEPLRKQFIKFANTKGLNVKSFDDLMITYGNVEGIYLTTNLLVNKGDRVIVEEPSYVNAIKAFELSGAEVVSVPQENDGVNIELLEQQMKNGAKIFYTIPNFSNPSGITMSEEKRNLVYDLAVKYNVIVLEDNAYGDLRYRGKRLKNIKEYDQTGHVVYLCSMSKLIAPAVRTGFMVADEQMIYKASVLKAVSTNGVTTIIQKALAKMFDENDMYYEIQKICDIYSGKMYLMESSMDKYFPASVVHSRPDGGMYIWVTMPKGTNVEKFCRESAIRLNIPITPGNGFCVKEHDECTSMRFNFVKESLPDIEKGIKLVGGLMERWQG